MQFAFFPFICVLFAVCVLFIFCAFCVAFLRAMLPPPPRSDPRTYPCVEPWARPSQRNPSCPSLQESACCWTRPLPPPPGSISPRSRGCGCRWTGACRLSRPGGWWGGGVRALVGQRCTADEPSEHKPLLHDGGFVAVREEDLGDATLNSFAA